MLILLLNNLFEWGNVMAQIDDDIAAVAQIRGVLDSVLVWIQSDAARIQAAIDAALANGATGAQLQPLTDAVNATLARSNEIAAAIASAPSTPVPGATS